LVIGLAEFDAGTGRSHRRRLREVLLERDEVGLAGDDLAAVGWLKLSGDAYARRNWSDARQYGRRAKEISGSLGGAWVQAQHQAALIEAASASAQGDFIDALDVVEAALTAFPDDASPLSDPTYARFSAWEGGLWSAAMSFEVDDETRLGSRVRRASQSRQDLEERYETGSEADAGSPCGAWTSQTPPRYPPSEEGRGRVGAAILAYDLTDDGHVTNARVLVPFVATPGLTTRFEVSVPIGLPELYRWGNDRDRKSVV